MIRVPLSQGWSRALAYLPGVAIISWKISQWCGIEGAQAAALVPILAACASMLAIVAAYRLSSFHPLAPFPGPVLYKLTNIKLAVAVATGYRYLTMEALHKKYGKIVRIGPNKLSINSHTALHHIYKSSRCMDKSDAYDLGHATSDGLFFMREREVHARRRAVWAPAFTNAMIEAHQSYLDDSIAELSNCMLTRVNNRGVVDLSRCIQHWSFDFMGHLVFGTCSAFNMMKEGDKHNLVRGGQDAMVTFEILGEIPWLFKILWYFPMTKSIHALHQFAASMAERRKASGGSEIPDICSFLLGERGTENVERLSDAEIAVDSLFGIQAGSDTTSGILTFLFFYLLSDPQRYVKLQNELEEAFPSFSGTIDAPSLHHLPYLNAVVKEALRLGTPFGGLARVVQSGGVMIDDVHIPGGTIVSVPVYAIHVSEEYFWPDSKSFIPERWLPGALGSDAKLEEAAFIPFSFGPFGCLGKNLAIRELLAVTARLVLTFDMSLAPEFNKHGFQTGIRNMKTTIFPTSLDVIIQERMRFRHSDAEGKLKTNS